MCSFCLATTDDGTWRLGTSFLKDWYITHSDDDNKFGFAPYLDSWRSHPWQVTGTAPVRSITSYQGELRVLNEAPPNWVAAIMLSCAGLTFLALAFFTIFVTFTSLSPKKPMEKYVQKATRHNREATTEDGLTLVLLQFN